MANITYSPAAFVASDPANGRELWQVEADGSVTLLADIAPGSGSSNPSSLTLFNGVLYFLAQDPEVGTRLWKLGADGTPEAVSPPGMYFANNNAAAKGFGGESQSQLVVFGDQLVFVAGVEGQSTTALWSVGADQGAPELFAAIPDGRARSIAIEFGGTLIVNADVVVGEFGSIGQIWSITTAGVATPLTTPGEYPNGMNVAQPKIAGDTMYFMSYDGVWSVTGDSVESVFARDPDQSVEGYAVVGEAVFISLYTPETGFELFRVDPSGQAQLVVDLVPGKLSSGPFNLQVFAGDLYFTASGPDFIEHLYRLDGTDPEAIPEQLTPPISVSAALAPSGTVEFGGALYYAGYFEDGTSRLVRIDADGLVTEIGAFNDIRELKSIGDILYISGAGPQGGGAEVWALTAGSTEPLLLANINQTLGLQIVTDSFQGAGGAPYVVANGGFLQGVWSLSATGGTNVVPTLRDADPLTQDIPEVYSGIDELDGAFYYVSRIYSADSQDVQIFRADGSGVTQVTNFEPQAESYIYSLFELDGAIYFDRQSTDDFSTYTRASWKLTSDGVLSEVLDGAGNPLNVSGSPIVVGGVPYLSASNDSVGGLWKINAEGEFEFVAATEYGGSRLHVADVGGSLYYAVASVSTSAGLSIFRLDAEGNPEAVVSGFSSYQALHEIGGSLVFVAPNESGSQDVYLYDGTNAPVALSAFGGNTFIPKPVEVGDILYFTVIDFGGGGNALYWLSPQGVVEPVPGVPNDGNTYINGMWAADDGLVVQLSGTDLPYGLYHVDAAGALTYMTGEPSYGSSPAEFTSLLDDVNLPPETVTLDGAAIDELAIAGTVVGFLATVDPDDTSGFTYTLIDDAGGRFVIVDGEVRVADGLLLDFEQSETHTITVQSTDSGGLSTQTDLVIAVGNVDPEIVLGNSADNTFVGGALADSLRGLGGADTLTGGEGNDVLDGGTGTDTMSGETGNDTYYVDNIGDRVLEGAGGGTDQIRATGLNLDLNATVGLQQVERAYVYGAIGNTIYGNALNNVIAGNTGNNRLEGRDGSDQIAGGGGNDFIIGGAGRDGMTGGTGRDGFRFITIAEAGNGAGVRDIITDFATSTETGSTLTSDYIDLSLIDANLTNGTHTFAFIGTGAAFTAAGQLRARIEGGNTLIEGNVNADLGADFQIQLNGLKTLVAGDFIL